MIEEVRKGIKGTCCCWNSINGLDEQKAVHVYRAQRCFLVDTKRPDFKRLGFWNSALFIRLGVRKMDKAWKNKT